MEGLKKCGPIEKTQKKKKFYDEYIVGFITGNLDKFLVWKCFWWFGLTIITLGMWYVTVDSYNSKGIIEFLKFLWILFIIWFVMMLETQNFKEHNGITEKTKSVETMMSFLPLDKKDIWINAAANKIINGVPMFIFMSVIIFFSEAKGEVVGLRGILLLISILILAIYSLQNINLYTERFWRIKVKEKVVIKKLEKKDNIKNFVIGIGSGIIFNVIFSLSLLDIKLNIPPTISNFIIFQMLGNKLVGIIILIFSIIAFYYFNYTYIVKGIKEEGWKLWKD